MTLVLIAACGAKSGLSTSGDPDASRPDGTSRDSSRDRGQDVPIPDAGVGACELAPAGGPANVHEDRSGFFDRPAAVFLEGFQAVANFVPVDDDRIADARTRNVIPGMAVAVSPVTTFSFAAQPVVVASNGRQLLSCESQGMNNILTLRDAGFSTLSTFDLPLGGETCEDVGSAGDFWFVGFFGADMVWPLTPDLIPFRPPARAIPTFDGPPTRIRFGAGADGVMHWVAPGFTDRSIYVQSWPNPEDEPQNTGRLDAAHGPNEVPAAIERWPFVAGALAVGYYDDQALRLTVLNAAGEVILSPEPLGFAFEPAFEPALASTPDGLVVAALNYGDDDPTSGELVTFSVGPSGGVRPGPAFPVRRPGIFRQGGVDAVANGNRVMVHWADVAPDGTGITRVTFVDCN